MALLNIIDFFKAWSLSYIRYSLYIDGQQYSDIE